MKKNWEVKKLGQVCEIKTGKKDVNQGNPNGKFPFFTCAREHTYSDEFSFDTEALLIAGNGDVGTVSYYKGKFEAYQRTYVLFNFKNISPRFLFFILDGYLKQTVSKQKLGNTMPYIKMSMLADFKIPLPPFSEQKRIVTVLDETFVALEKAKENAEKNLQNARELFESYLQNIFANPGEGWEEKMLEEIGETQTGTTPKTVDKENYGNHIPFITPADIDISGDGTIRYREEGLSEKGLENGRKMKTNSILMVCIGASIGKVGFVDRDVSCNQQINSLTVKKGLCPKFFYYALSTKTFFEGVIKNSAQATLPIINKGKWEKLTVSYPPSEKEQQFIVAKLDALLAETKKLEFIYQQKLSDLEELKKSVLHKAFNGELVGVRA
jgi:type I restriction enzyme S subunit